MIVLLGKHQFTVSSIDDSGVSDSESISSSLSPRNAVSNEIISGMEIVGTGHGGRRNSSSSKNNLNPEALINLVESAERIISDFSVDASKTDKEEISAMYAIFCTFSKFRLFYFNYFYFAD
jgi:hypothetical protein